MLLAHLADIHLGYRQYYRQTPLGLNQREVDVARVFNQAVGQVIDAKPDVVLVAGDLFHAVRPTNQAIVHCFRQFQRLREGLPAAEIVVIAGNHDTPRASETGSILKLFLELGVHVATEEPIEFEFPALDLAVRAVPHHALVAVDRPDLRPSGRARYEILTVHGEVEGLFPLDRWWAEPGGAALDPAQLSDAGWSYVALGHYHVMREVKPRVWYAGALDYVTPNPWGEFTEQRKSGIKGKGWLLVDLDAVISGTAKPVPQWVVPERRLFDLKAVEGKDLSAAELDRAIQERLATVPGGIADQLVRLVVYDVARHVAREIDHAAVRAAKAAALHFHLDLRRPDVHRIIGTGAPGGRQTLPDMVRAHLARRLLPERLDRDRFVERGVTLLESVSFEPGPEA